MTYLAEMAINRHFRQNRQSSSFRYLSNFSFLPNFAQIAILAKIATLQGATFDIQFESPAVWRFFAIFAIAFISGHKWRWALIKEHWHWHPFFIAFGIPVSPEITLQKTYFVGRGKSVSLHCQVEGSPLPSITWTPCNPQGNACDRSMLNISKAQNNGVYTCTAKNSLGNDTASTNLGESQCWVLMFCRN